MMTDFDVEPEYVFPTAKLDQNDDEKRRLEVLERKAM